MNPDDYKQAWQAQSSQTQLSIHADVLLKEVQRNQQSFAATIFWRDVREVGVSLLMIPAWIYMGIALKLPWSWYLTVPALVWVFGYILVDRRRHRRQSPHQDESLIQCVQDSL